ncbi:MAG TPA: serine hydrolase domain-containing protein [Allosphingosinicella sp.]|nr:serine hydrolase domain-containing protein [Allosphingosinicella sp.]
MLKRPFLYLPVAGLLLIFLYWAATHVSVGGGAPAKPELGISNQQLATIETRQNAPGSVADYKRLDQRLQTLMRNQRMVGLAVGVVENGEIRFLKGYGETAAGSGEAVTTDTVFRWASVSKGVAGVMVALLADEGKLSLYEPVAKYSSSLRLPAGNEQKATVADLLSHRLGLFGHAQDSKLEDGMDPRFLRASLAQLNSICSPGTCWAYQNVAYDAASEIVEKVTGKSYAEAVRERLFGPLGMVSASMTRDGLVTARRWARPHVGGKNSKPVEVAEPYYRVPAAGGVNSTIKDLAIWMQAQMGLKASVLSPSVLESVQTARASTPGELGRMRKYRERVNTAAYGLGWRVYDYSGHRVVGHHGGVRGYRSLIMFDPALKSGVVALWNGSSGQPWGLEFEVMDMFYRLEPRDWLALDSKAAVSSEPAEPEVENVSSENSSS